MKTFFPRMNADAGAAGGGGGAAAVLPAGGAAPAAGAAPAGGAAPAPYFSDMFGKDGTINRDSFTRLPENLRGLADGELKNITSADQLFQKLHGLSTVAGRKGLAPLPANASAEDIAAQQTVLRAVLGVPEKPDGYGVVRPAEVPEERWNPKLATDLSAMLHKYNAAPGLAKELISMEVARMQQADAANQQYEKEFYDGQEKEFRDALAKTSEDYDKSMTVINGVAEKFNIKADSPILKNAQVRLLLKGVSTALGESKFVGTTPSGNATMTDQATAEDIVHNKQNPDYLAYWANVNGNPDHPKAAEVKKRVEALYASAARAASAAKR